MPFNKALLGLGILCAAGVGISHAAGIERVPSTYPNSPILQAVTLPGNGQLTYLSGILPDPVDAKAAKDDLRAAGTTEQQTVVVFRKIEAVLAQRGLTLGDVVQLRVYLVGDPAKGGRLDFDGLQAGFRQFFGTDKQPLKPARTTVQVAGLVLPGALIEVEAVAATATPTSSPKN
ncbi:RidA family protein [Pseudomonas sp. GV071]|uniref:RidA family protein n=1 Tax=Pseudomonas sp. GV071 TaxID=2135754 RepID=UPI000D346C90|nr:RidA family protein [Pseudomonas sp. GV071]PTQ74185.1 enamine deaminase RidA (YjgF/YER057c/UK114 family) [Pseudomonas sp. GV071]